MKLKELVAVLDGRENVELRIDGLQLHFTAGNAKPDWMERKIESIRLDPNIYLGIIIHIADVVDPAPTTNPDYWDCECDGKYIQCKSVAKCPLCGASSDEMPDSRQNEIDEGTHFAERHPKMTVEKMKKIMDEAIPWDELKKSRERYCFHSTEPHNDGFRDIYVAMACVTYEYDEDDRTDDFVFNLFLRNDAWIDIDSHGYSEKTIGEIVEKWNELVWFPREEALI